MSEEMLKAMQPGMVPGRHRLFVTFLTPITIVPV